MAFTEPPSVRYEIINGKKVPVVECETEVVLRNKKTGHEYNSDKEAEDDVNDPSTETKAEDIRRDVLIKAAIHEIIKSEVGE